MSSLLVLLAALGLWPAQPLSEQQATAIAGSPGIETRWAPDVRAARRYANGRTGVTSFSVRTRERSWHRRPRRQADSASVIKAMFLVAYLGRADVRRRALTDGERALLAPMIRWSSNDAATALRNTMGPGPVLRLARRARMRDFALSPVWGLSQITAQDQSSFFLRLPELVPKRHRAYALALLRQIVPEQGWGVGQVKPKGWRLHFKGGWGAGTGAVSHQVALLRRGRQRVAVAVLTTGSPSHAYSQETLRGVFVRLLRGLEDAPRATESPRALAGAPLTSFQLALR